MPCEAFKWGRALKYRKAAPRQHRRAQWNVSAAHSVSQSWAMVSHRRAQCASLELFVQVSQSWAVVSGRVPRLG